MNHQKPQGMLIVLEKKNNKQKLCDLLAVSQKNINIELFELDDLELKKENC